MGYRCMSFSELRTEVAAHLADLQSPVKWVPSRDPYDTFGSEGEGALVGAGQVAFSVGLPQTDATSRQTQRAVIQLETVVGIRWMARIPPGCRVAGYDRGLDMERAMIEHLLKPPTACFLKYVRSQREVVDGCLMGVTTFRATHTIPGGR